MLKGVYKSYIGQDLKNSKEISITWNFAATESLHRKEKEFLEYLISDDDII
jgi:hypothetical protein